MTGSGFEIVIPARGLRAPGVVELGIEAERLGWSGVWVSEVMSLDASAILGALSRVTRSVDLGTAIIPVTTRSAALLAMMSTTLAQLAPGRFTLGVGVSTPAIVADRHDRRVTAPATTAAGVVDVVRRALRGETVEHASAPAVRDLRIDRPGEVPPVMLAALGPRMTDVAVEVADGLILNLIPLARAAEIAARAAGERGAIFTTAISQRVCVDPTPEDLRSIRREIASYCRVPVYAESLASLGFDLDELRAASREDAAALLPAELLYELVITGSAAECRDRIDAFRAAGVRPLLVPVGAADTSHRLLSRLIAA